MVSVTWQPRATILEPRAALIPRAALAPLVERLAQRRIRGIAVHDQLVLLDDDLPWVRGVRYFGRDADAPSLLLPTMLSPSVPPALLERAVRRRASGSGPWLVDGRTRTIVPVVAAGVLDWQLVQRWLEGPGHEASA